VNTLHGHDGDCISQMQTKPCSTNSYASSRGTTRMGDDKKAQTTGSVTARTIQEPKPDGCVEAQRTHQRLHSIHECLPAKLGQ
jgi:hypothetical protein